MKEHGSDEPARKRKRRNGETLIFGLALAGLTVFFSLLSWINGGGALSMVSGISTARAKAPSIDIDINALRWPIMMAIGVVLLGLCRLFGIRAAKKRNQLFVTLAIVGGGFVVDGFYGELLITRYMASYGYSRCPFLDHEVGQGKGKVWFGGYVRDSLKCLPALNREQEPLTE